MTVLLAETATQFAWRTLALGEYPPPVPKRGEQYGPDPDCWLCGGETGGVGWPFALAIPPTYTNHTLAARPMSASVCQPCAAMGSKETWERYVATVPDAGLKSGHAMSWRCYSHVFHRFGHECPNRARWRELLLDPPEPPFLLVVALSGQKHLIFRSRIAHSRDAYPVQFEEAALLVHRAEFAACLADVETVYALGFSKDSILSGRYHPAQTMKVGIGAWRTAEAAIVPWRTRQPRLLELACHVAKREEVIP